MSFCSFCLFFRVVVGKYYYTILRSGFGGTGSEVVAHELWVAKPERASAIRLVEPFVEKRVIILALRVRDGTSRAGAIVTDVAVYARPGRHILDLSAKFHFVSCRSFVYYYTILSFRRLTRRRGPVHHPGVLPGFHRTSFLRFVRRFSSWNHYIIPRSVALRAFALTSSSYPNSNPTTRNDAFQFHHRQSSRFRLRSTPRDALPIHRRRLPRLHRILRAKYHHNSTPNESPRHALFRPRHLTSIRTSNHFPNSTLRAIRPSSQTLSSNRFPTKYSPLFLSLRRYIYHYTIPGYRTSPWSIPSTSHRSQISVESTEIRYTGQPPETYSVFVNFADGTCRLIDANAS